MWQWYVSKEGRRTGPLAFGQLQAMVAAGELLLTDFVASEGSHRWILAGDVAGLFTPPAPPPELVPLESDSTASLASPALSGETLQVHAGESLQPPQFARANRSPVPPPLPAAHAPNPGASSAKSRVSTFMGGIHQAVQQFSEQTRDAAEATAVRYWNRWAAPLVSPCAPPVASESSSPHPNAEGAQPNSSPTGQSMFRWMRNQTVQGVLTADELQERIARGDFGESDWIAVETWVPATALQSVHGLAAISGKLADAARRQGGQALSADAAGTPGAAKAGQLLLRAAGKLLKAMSSSSNSSKSGQPLFAGGNFNWDETLFAELPISEQDFLAAMLSEQSGWLDGLWGQSAPFDV